MSPKKMTLKVITAPETQPPIVIKNNLIEVNINEDVSVDTVEIKDKIFLPSKKHRNRKRVKMRDLVPLDQLISGGPKIYTTLPNAIQRNWKTKDGRIIPLEQLSNEHLVAIIRLLNKNNKRNVALETEYDKRYKQMLDANPHRTLKQSLGMTDIIIDT